MSARRITIELSPTVEAWLRRQPALSGTDEAAAVEALLEAISTRHAAGEALAETILRSAVDFAVITTTDDRVVTSWSAGAEHLFGWPAEAVIGRSADLIFTAEDLAADAPAREARQAFAEGKALDERWHVRADGSRFWASGLMMPLVGQGGHGLLKIVRDRTSERKAEARFNVMTATLPGLVWIADDQGLVLETNKKLRDFTARSSAELIGAGWLSLVHPDEVADVAEAWNASIRTGDPFESRQRLRGKDGDYRCFDCRAVPERDEAGRVIHWLATCIDVENEQRARAALERLNLSLEHQATQSTADMAAAIEELRREVTARSKAEAALRQSQKMQAIGQLTGGVAHDFNNLLTVIRSSADLLRRPALSEARRERYLDAIAQTADRAAALTAQLLAFARRQPLEPVVFDVARRLRANADILETTVGPKIRLVMDIQCSPCPAYADPVQFETAVMNVVVNARDALGGEGEIAVRVSEVDHIPARRRHATHEGAFIAISVEDRGPGISPEHMAMIFEPFFTTKAAGIGTGLGLSQVLGFAKQSDGDAVVESTPGQGTTVTLYLPKVDPEEAESVEPEAIDGDAPRGRSILVVEDNDMIGDFAVQLLEDLGYRAHRVNDGHAALDALVERPQAYDAIFSDVVMPGLNGLDMAKAVRKTHPDLPILLTTGYSHVLADEGTDGFSLLKKPYSADALARALMRALPHRAR